MRPYVTLSTLVALAALLVSLLAGGHRKAVLTGSSVASVTALASLVAMARVSRPGKKSMNGPLAVIVVTFMARMILVSLGTLLVVRSGESIVAFVLAFFLPFFVFGAIEATFVHSLRRAQGPTA